MPLISTLGAASSRGFGEFNQQATVKYIEDYFSTWLYTGNGTSQTISNGIGLADTAAWSSYVLTGSSTNTIGNGVTVDSSGNFYAAGSDEGTNYSGTRPAALTVKYNSSGVLQWQRIAYSASGNNAGAGVAVDSSGNVYSLFYNTASGNAFNLRKYDSSGTLQWQRNLGGGSGINSIATSVAVDSGSNAYVVGRSPEYSGDQNSIVVAKYNSSGTIQWQKLIRQSTLGEGEAVAVDSSDNIYVVGTTSDGSYSYAILIKMDTSGAITWQRKLRHSSNGSAGYSVAIDSSGNAYMGGAATDNSGSYSFVSKFNSSGTLQWQRYFYDGTSASQNVRGIYVNSSGDVHIAAILSSSPSYVGVAKYNSSGTLQWQRKFPSITSLTNNCISGDSSGNIYLNLRNASATNQFVVKLKSDGTTTSGSAFVTMLPGTATSANASLSEATSTANNNTGSLTTATGAITDYAGALPSSTYTQAAVTGAGGLVWIKNRSQATWHQLTDTSRGATKAIFSNSTNAETTKTTGLTSFLASGFSIGDDGDYNDSTRNYVSWTWRETPKFFDVVTYTGNGASNQTINHNLGSVPGMMIVKLVTNTSTYGWQVWHRSLSNSDALLLNTTGAPITDLGWWFNTAPTATTFRVGDRANVNGETYVAYLFAHDAGGFGLDGSQNVISCGSYTYSGGANPTITLGYEPQWVLRKRSDSTGNWELVDNMRGLYAPTLVEPSLQPNLANVESSSTMYIQPTATGFVDANATTGATYIYMAIRRGPMKVPTDATTVFSPVARTGTGAAATISNIGFAPDLIMSKTRAVTNPDGFYDRLRGYYPLSSQLTATEDTTANNGVLAYNNTSINLGIDNAGTYGGLINQNTYTYANWIMGRAPSFMDVVCYSGTGTTTQNVTHNLGVQPELIIYKTRSNTADWIVHTPSLISQGKFLFFNRSDAAADNSTQGYTNSGTPTSTLIRPGMTQLNMSGWTYVAYLFATCTGVSKVGTYTGTGATQTISCGFTGGARYVMIKRTDSTGNWWVWDTARGMVAGTDPRLAYNSTAAETNANWVYTITGGFQIVTSDATVNASGGSYLFFAVA